MAMDTKRIRDWLAYSLAFTALVFSGYVVAMLIIYQELRLYEYNNWILLFESLVVLVGIILLADKLNEEYPPRRQKKEKTKAPGVVFPVPHQ